MRLTSGGAGGNRTPVHQPVDEPATTVPDFEAVAASPAGRLVTSLRGGHRRLVFPWCQPSFRPSVVFPTVILRFCCRAAVDRPRAALLLTMSLHSPEDQAARANCSLAILVVAPFSESEQLGSQYSPLVTDVETCQPRGVENDQSTGGGARRTPRRGRFPTPLARRPRRPVDLPLGVALGDRLALVGLAPALARGRARPWPGRRGSRGSAARARGAPGPPAPAAGRSRRGAAAACADDRGHGHRRRWRTGTGAMCTPSSHSSPPVVAGEGVGELDVSEAQALHLAAGEHDAGLDRVEHVVVVAGAAVAGDQLGAVAAGRLPCASVRGGHRKATATVPPCSSFLVPWSTRSSPSALDAYP